MVVIDEEAQKPPLTATASELRKMLDVIEREILPKTTDGVDSGNKVFGAAILDGETLDLSMAETNAETTCPLFHGEVHLIYRWSQCVPADRRGPEAQKSVFLSTHEPCCMCISSIVWAGFPKVYYFFPYEVTAAQGIPHDINIMHELWGVDTYRKTNRYCSAAGIVDLVEALPDGDEKEALRRQCERLSEVYDGLSGRYHDEKASNKNNSLVLG